MRLNWKWIFFLPLGRKTHEIMEDLSTLNFIITDLNSLGKHWEKNSHLIRTNTFCPVQMTKRMKNEAR